MNIQLFAAAAAAVCALAACQSNANQNNGMNQPQNHHHHSMNNQQGNFQPTPVNMPDEYYGCRNGMGVTIQYIGNDRIALSTNTDSKARAVLSQTRAASGELYTNPQGLYGKPTEWHQKAGDAVFAFSDPYGNKTETVCRKQTKKK
ncbi:MliC family protein [Conchiformibius steedae]|uniref:MliC family protein n=1 Tax=Conchiformibius steedae TaxID=153493 RepID=UPI0026F1CD77|nr:MliC family protein [Conchiformibius steedae]